MWRILHLLTDSWFLFHPLQLVPEPGQVPEEAGGVVEGVEGEVMYRLLVPVVVSKKQVEGVGLEGAEVLRWL